MSNKYDQQIETMQRLMNYGLNESSNAKGNAVVEYHAVGADGKTYGIIRECNKFYIKVAPAKDTVILAEDYDYIDGFMNRKQHEYTSYAKASKQFDLKMKSLNEAMGVNTTVSQFKPVEAAEWQVNETKEMRKEIDRYNQIVNNVGYILKENNNFSEAHTLPEAPDSHPSEKEVNSPYTDTAVAKGDKDFKETETNYQKAGGPYKEDGKVTSKDMQSDKNHTGKSDETYSEKAKYVPDNSVADKSPKGGKAVKMNEGRVIKLTEEQVLAWQKNADYMDKSHGTEIGDSAPYTENANAENIQECDAVHNNDNQNCPAPGTAEVGDTAPYDENVSEARIDVTDVVGVDDEEDFEQDDMTMDSSMGGVDDDWERKYNDWLMSDEDDDFIDAAIDLSTPYEGKSRNGETVSEGTVLDDFGKHPAYQKTPMTTPPNTEVSKSGRSWDDESVKGDKPFGQKIGDSAPYSEEVVDMLTDAIMNYLKGGKKKD